MEVISFVALAAGLIIGLGAYSSVCSWVSSAA